MGSNGLKNHHDGEKNEKSSGYQYSKLVIATKRILAKASIDPGFASMLDYEDLGGYDHGSWTDKRWITLKH
jgi:hypothetical protein